MLRTTFAALILVLAAACGGSDDPKETGGTGGSGAIGGSGGDAGSGGTGGSGGDAGSGGSGGTGGDAGSGGTGGTGGTGFTELIVQFDGFCAGSCNFMHRGDTRTLIAFGVDPEEEWIPLEGPLAYTSDDESIATVDETGLLTAVAIGETWIRLEVDGLTASVPIFIEAPLVAKVVADVERLDLEVGEDATVTAEALDFDGNLIPDAEFFVQSSNPFVATVSEEDGTITAVGPGTAWIGVFAANGTPRSEAMVVLTVTGGDPLPPGRTFDEVKVGASYGCARDATGDVWCWGFNFFGQLGQDPAENLEFDTPQRVDAGVSFTAVSAGDFHTCALDDAGAAWCWGSNGSGELGVEEEVENPVYGSYEPVPVAGGMVFSSITTGGDHTCALDLDGAAWCWGANFSGQLGNGGEEWTVRGGPVQVVGDHVFTGIVAGISGTCALDEDGAAWCWGDNWQGTLGDGGLNPGSNEPVPVVGDHTFTVLAGTGNHYCGLTTDGEAWCWGDNYSGQLGAENRSDFEWTWNEPVAVQGGHVFVGIATGAHHTCAIDEDGATWCFGNNDDGQLGSANPAHAGITPVPVAGDPGFQAISARNNTTCGTTADGATYCWGSNANGHLGAGWGYGLSPLPWPVIGG